MPSKANSYAPEFDINSTVVFLLLLTLLWCMTCTLNMQILVESILSYILMVRLLSDDVGIILTFACFIQWELGNFCNSGILLCTCLFPVLDSFSFEFCLLKICFAGLQIHAQAAQAAQKTQSAISSKQNLDKLETEGSADDNLSTLDATHINSPDVEEPMLKFPRRSENGSRFEASNASSDTEDFGNGALVRPKVCHSLPLWKVSSAIYAIWILVLIAHFCLKAKNFCILNSKDS